MATSRPKGYAAWNPRPEVRDLVNKAKGILEEYSSYGPMTARQIFYRLVGQHGYDKTEKAYKRLCEALVRARRAQMIPFHMIRDDGTVMQGGGYWTDVEMVYEGMMNTAKGFHLDRMSTQPVSIELWCEAAGMVPMLVNAVSEYDVPVYSTGGFSSVTVTHEVAQRIIRKDKPTVFLHVGDWDPSGQSIYNSMEEDIWSFCAAHGHYAKFTPTRVALTEDQVREHDIPTAPPKYSDTRSAAWGDETAQAEALPPDLLTQIVKDAVGEHIDDDEITAIEQREKEGRALLTTALEDVSLDE